tara:strand:- start:455 stop:979 length:525 start_codon:yes stop_codon:yes gene_type:complete
VNKIKIFIIILLLLTFSKYTYAQNIAYANLDTIIKTSKTGKDIITYFSKKNENLINKLKENEKIIREKEKSLLSQKNILEAEEFSKKIKIIKEEIKIFNDNNQKKIKNINAKREKVLKSFLVEINKVLKEFAEKNNIDIIISSNQMLIGKSNLDVTNDLLETVNKKIKNFKFEE